MPIFASRFLTVLARRGKPVSRQEAFSCLLGEDFALDVPVVGSLRARAGRGDPVPANAKPRRGRNSRYDPRNQLVACAAALGLVVLVAAGAAMAQGTPGSYYTFMVATGPLCYSGACPAAVVSANGERYELSGAGAFSTQTRSVTAAGNYTRKSPNGDALEAGVWVATKLVSFDSYGAAPEARTRLGPAAGSPPFGLVARFPMLAGAVPTGGLAVLRIRLLPTSGIARNATLQVNCAMGNVPYERGAEGVRLAFDGGGARFDEEAGGLTLFLRMGPQAGPPSQPDKPTTGASTPSGGVKR